MWRMLAEKGLLFGGAHVSLSLPIISMHISRFVSLCVQTYRSIQPSVFPQLITLVITTVTRFMYNTVFKTRNMTMQNTHMVKQGKPVRLTSSQALPRIPCDQTQESGTARPVSGNKPGIKEGRACCRAGFLGNRRKRLAVIILMIIIIIIILIILIIIVVV